MYLSPTFAKAEYVICTPEWENYTVQDGSGLYHDLWKKVYEDIHFSVQYATLSRCREQVSAGKAHAYPGSYIWEADGRNLSSPKPEYYLGIEFIAVAYHKGRGLDWSNESSLKGKRVAWELGYEFEKAGIVNEHVNKHNFKDLGNALKMLEANRLDYILDYAEALESKTEQLGLDNTLTIKKDVIKGPRYYMLFSNDAAGESMKAIWNQKMEVFLKDGTLAELYKKYSDKSYN